MESISTSSLHPRFRSSTSSCRIKGYPSKYDRSFRSKTKLWSDPIIRVSNISTSRCDNSSSVSCRSFTKLVLKPSALHRIPSSMTLRNLGNLGLAPSRCASSLNTSNTKNDSQCMSARCSMPVLLCRYRVIAAKSSLELTPVTQDSSKVVSARGKLAKKFPTISREVGARKLYGIIQRSVRSEGRETRFSKAFCHCSSAAISKEISRSKTSKRFRVDPSSGEGLDTCRGAVK